MARDQNPAPLPGVIVAGGLGSRLGGDKAFALLAGRPLIAHVVDRLQPQCGPLAINAAGDDPRFAPLALPVIEDADATRAGPLAGIAAALRWARDDLRATHVVTVPVDVPLLPPDLVARLAAAPGPARIARSNGRPHPVAGVFDVALLDGLEAFLRQDTRRAMMAWLDGVGATTVDFEPLQIGGAPVDPFFNVNTPEDLEAAEAILSRT